MGISYPVPYRKRCRTPTPPPNTDTNTDTNTDMNPTPTQATSSAPPAATPQNTNAVQPTPTPTTPTPAAPQHITVTQTITQTSTPRPQPQSQPEESLYFTYSSTLSLAHLSTICPKARFIGRGILRGYKWRISSTDGRPNVVVEGYMRSRVEGLVYRLSRAEQDALERYERVGIPVAAIGDGNGSGVIRITPRRVSVEAEVVSGHPELVGRTVRAILEQDARLIPEASYPRGFRASRTMRVGMIVRVPGELIGEGALRAEERPLLAMGMWDAMRLGVTTRWLNEVVYPRLWTLQGPAGGYAQAYGQVETQVEAQGQADAQGQAQGQEHDQDHGPPQAQAQDHSQDQAEVPKSEPE